MQFKLFIDNKGEETTDLETMLKSIKSSLKSNILTTKVYNINEEEGAEEAKKMG